MRVLLLASAALLAAPALMATSAPALAQEHVHDHGAAAGEPAAPDAPGSPDHGAMDHGAMDHGAMDHSSHDAAMAGNTPPPPIPSDWAADAVHDPAEMAAARKALFASTSDTFSHMVLIDQLEWRQNKGHDAIAWSGKAWFGGDIDRVLIRSEGEAETGGAVEKAEVRALWSHAIAPYFNLEAGVRQDLEAGPRRTHATIGVDGMLPYWIELEAALFVSHKGEVLARAELSHDMRITQALILQPSAEFNLSAQDIPQLGIGSGLSDMELGLRLRYAPQPEFAPYIGVHWERKFGDTASYARAAGEGVSATSFVAGVRFWF
jgi:copper resistance protein B